MRHPNAEEERADDGAAATSGPLELYSVWEGSAVVSLLL